MARKNTKKAVNTTKPAPAQQGDVCLDPTTIPADAKPKAGLVLALGEATGHKHVVEPMEGSSAELLKLGDRVFLRILGGDARVVHEEHCQITLPPGEYEVGIVNEYDYDAEEARKVVD